jgi:hypothetical protein
VVDRDGWTAAVTGMPYVKPDRAAQVALTGAVVGCRSLGLCSVEPLAGGWLIRAADEPVPGATRIVLDLASPRRWSMTVSGSAGSWTHELSPRHAELLYLLALHRTGRSAAGWPRTCSATRAAR